MSAESIDSLPRILVVDDHPTNLKLVGAALRRSFEVIGVGSAEEARERLGSARFDLILMDIALPGLDGLSFTRELRLRPGFRTPVVALSAHALADSREAAADAGCAGFISKPVDTRTLGAELRRFLITG